jgi:hypothetical protein
MNYEVEADLLLRIRLKRTHGRKKDELRSKNDVSASDQDQQRFETRSLPTL